MAGNYQHIAQYLHRLQSRYDVQICIKDFCGFNPINKELTKRSVPFLPHTNPYCMYMKSNQAHWWQCLSMIRGMFDKLERKNRPTSASAMPVLENMLCRFTAGIRCWAR